MKIRFLDKLAAIAALLVASACPACFPLLAIIGSTLGLSFLRPYEGVMMYVFQVLILLAFIESIISFLKHRKRIPLLLNILGSLLIFFAFYVKFIPFFIYAGLSLLLAGAFRNFLEEKKCNQCKITSVSKGVILKSKIKCPFCGYIKEETMFSDSCQHFYECGNCKKILQPKDRDCCVFCSYGTVKCPPKQKS